LTIDEEAGNRPMAAQPGLEVPQESAVVLFQVPREEAPSSPEDIRNVIEDLSLTPRLDEGKMRGFSVGRLRFKDFLFQLGVRTGDVIKGMDDYEFKTPADLDYFFQRLARGGDLTVMVERRGQLQKLKALIE